MMDIAVVGSGISGLTAAYHLARKHRVTVFEANDYLGGHTHTHEISMSGLWPLYSMPIRSCRLLAARFPFRRGFGSLRPQDSKSHKN